MPIKRAKCKAKSRFNANWFSSIFREENKKYKIEYDKLENEVNSTIAKLNTKKLKYKDTDEYLRKIVKLLPKTLISRVLSFPVYKIRHRYKATFLKACKSIHEDGNYIRKY